MNSKEFFKTICKYAEDFADSVFSIDIYWNAKTYISVFVHKENCTTVVFHMDIFTYNELCVKESEEKMSEFVKWMEANIWS